LFFKEQGQREFVKDKELELFSPFAQEGIKQDNQAVINQTIGLLNKYTGEV